MMELIEIVSNESFFDNNTNNNRFLLQLNFNISSVYYTPNYKYLYI